MRAIVLGMLVSVSSLLATQAMADDSTNLVNDGSIYFTGGYGLTSIKANEYVFDHSKKVSQLIWKSSYVQTLSGALTVELDKNLYVRMSGATGSEGNGHMADYDWLVDGKPWSDRSLHPDTRLNTYFNGALEAGREVYSTGATKLSLGGGVEYTNVKWTAWGGSYAYSNGGYRNSHGKFADDEKGISYRQSWPVAYLAANLSHQVGSWNFSGAVQAGVTKSARGTDDHWLRNLRFYDYYQNSPVLGLTANVDYQFSSHAAFYVNGAFDRMFRTRADTKEIQTATNSETWYKNDAGGDYRSISLSFGLKGNF